MTIWDRGLQSERTRLAWVRTATALAVGGLAAGGAALRAGAVGMAIIAFGATAMCGAVLLARTGARYRRIQRALHEGQPLNEQADAILAWAGVLAAAAGSLLVVIGLA